MDQWNKKSVFQLFFLFSFFSMNSYITESIIIPAISSLSESIKMEP